MVMKELFLYGYERLCNGDSIVLVTIISGHGSTPRGAGAMMVVAPNAPPVGTIGGGAIEYKAQQIAQEALEKGKSLIQKFCLSANDAAGLGMICGGDVTVYFQYVSPTAENIDLMNAIARLCDDNADSWIIIKINTDFHWEMCASLDEGKIICSSSDFSCPDLKALLKSKSILLEYNSSIYYGQPLVRAGRVYLFGGGHIGQALVPVLSRLTFPCVVIDDRNDFCNNTLFPLANETILSSFTDIFKQIMVGPSDYIVIITRGHQNDYEVLAQALHTPACYIGMVGSQRKVSAAFDRLTREDGFNESDIKRIYAPIGLDIGADTPEEIAVSIAAQLIKIRSQKNEE